MENELLDRMESGIYCLYDVHKTIAETITEKEVATFRDDANSKHSTINFTYVF